MRVFRNLSTAAALLSLNCGHLPAQRGDRAMSESPWELRLSVTGGVKLRAVLHNRSKLRQTYLYHSELQPTELILTLPGGQPIEPFDTRADAKFDNTIYREMYQEAAPQSDVTLTEASVEQDGTLRWGPFLFHNLAAGTYRAQVIWRSETDQYYEPKPQKTRSMKDVWKGEVSSNTVELRVP